MQTSDSSNFFQSDAQHARASFRRAKHLLHAETGDPIKLNSRPLRVVIRQKEDREADAFCAESGFVIRRVGLESGKTKQIYRGHTGPVTSIDFYTIPATSSSPAREVLISGSWDRSVRIWDTLTKTPLSTTIAHTDFVKTLIVIPSLKVVVTGSSDRDIRIWDLTSLEGRDLSSIINATPTSELIEETTILDISSAATSLLPPITVPSGAAPPLAKSKDPLPVLITLKAHIRPPERLGFYRITNSASKDEENEDSIKSDTGRVALVSADSLGFVIIWEVWKDEKTGELKSELKSNVKLHENGIYDLVICENELWTASADNSVLLSTFDSSSPSTPPKPTLRIPHYTGMRSLLSVSHSLPSLNSSHLITGSTDESIRIFDLSELDSQPRPKDAWIGLAALPESTLPGMIVGVEGHSHDIIDLGMYTRVDDEGKMEAWLLSSSVDGTLRRWKWPEVLVANEKSIGKIIEVDSEVVENNLLTEEEERELAELMGEDG